MCQVFCWLVFFLILFSIFRTKQLVSHSTLAGIFFFSSTQCSILQKYINIAGEIKNPPINIYCQKICRFRDKQWQERDLNIK